MGSAGAGRGFASYEKSLERVDDMKTDEGGYSFCEANVNGGWWAEGTAFTVLMLRLRGEDDKAATALKALASMQLENGLFLAATVDDLSTGFDLFTGEAWTYGTDAHVAPTAWFIMATTDFNPYKFE